MCRMLAIVSHKPAPVDTLMAFRALADTGRNFRDFGCPQPSPKSGHPDGWGIACIGQEGEFYARGPAKATEDPKYEDAVRRLARVCSPPLILVAHLRYASKKDTIQERYSHPFRREVDGRVLFFAHNGEIEEFGVRDGKIDSQFIYDRFVESLGTEERPISEFKQAIAKAKAGIDEEFPRKVESYTFLLIDGDRVIAHRDARTCVPYYTLHETGTEEARIVCSRSFRRSRGAGACSGTANSSSSGRDAKEAGSPAERSWDNRFTRHKRVESRGRKIGSSLGRRVK